MNRQCINNKYVNVEWLRGAYQARYHSDGGHRTNNIIELIPQRALMYNAVFINELRLASASAIIGEWSGFAFHKLMRDYTIGEYNNRRKYCGISIHS